MNSLYDSKGNKIAESSIQLSAKEKTILKTVIELAQTTQQLTKKDIKTWRSAWQQAINVENPRRQALLRVYTDVDIDAHITGANEQLRNSIMSRAFKVADKKSKKENPELTEILEAKWFKQFIGYILDTRYWGHSLVQFGDIVSGPTMSMNGVDLVPREHVSPEFGVILIDPTDEFNKGINYREGRIADWVLEIGTPKGLGLFLKLAPHAISKKNMMAFWDQFGELFGMPIRIGKTNTTNARDNQRLERMLAEMGTAAYGIFPVGTEIDIKESSRGDAYNVYDKRIDRANSEISKAMLTVTMTMENGSSLSQSEVHEKMLLATIEMEADRVRDIVNNDLFPKLIKLGFPFKEGDQFVWDYSTEYTPDQQTANERMILEHFEVDPKYFEEKYGMKILGKKVNPTVQFSTEKKKLS